MKVTIEDREARTLTADMPLAPQELGEETLRRKQQAGGSCWNMAWSERLSRLGNRVAAATPCGTAAYDR